MTVFRRRRTEDPRRFAPDYGATQNETIANGLSARRGVCDYGRSRQLVLRSWILIPRWRTRKENHKRQVLEFLLAARRDGKDGRATARTGTGNTLLNYCGIRTDFIDYTVDGILQTAQIPAGTLFLSPSSERNSRTKPGLCSNSAVKLKDGNATKRGISGMGRAVCGPFRKTPSFKFAYFNTRSQTSIKGKT